LIIALAKRAARQLRRGLYAVTRLTVFHQAVEMQPEVGGFRRRIGDAMAGADILSE